MHQSVKQVKMVKQGKKGICLKRQDIDDMIKNLHCNKDIYQSHSAVHINPDSKSSFTKDTFLFLVIHEVLSAVSTFLT